MAKMLERRTRAGAAQRPACCLPRVKKRMAKVSFCKTLPLGDGTFSPRPGGGSMRGGAHAPALVAGVRVSKGRGESKRLTLWQIFAHFLAVQKVSGARAAQARKTASLHRADKRIEKQLSPQKVKSQKIEYKKDSQRPCLCKTPRCPAGSRKEGNP